MKYRDHNMFSFSRGEKAHGKTLVTDLLAAQIRLPLVDGDDPFCGVERIAQKAIGLSPESPFVVIERARLMESRPCALHRVFLKPSRFPLNFLDLHDFQRESLIEIYEHYGYQLVSRDTVLMARAGNTYEFNMIYRRYLCKPISMAVLDAEQQLYAKDPQTGKLFILEFLKASYFENWKYEMQNRPA